MNSRKTVKGKKPSEEVRSGLNAAIDAGPPLSIILANHKIPVAARCFPLGRLPRFRVRVLCGSSLQERCFNIFVVLTMASFCLVVGACPPGGHSAVDSMSQGLVACPEMFEVSESDAYRQCQCQALPQFTPTVTLVPVRGNAAPAVSI